MTTYKQNTPETVYVSPAIYQEVLTGLDPFVSSGFEHTMRKTDEPTPVTTCPHFRTASYGCEQCFMSHEEIARELAGEDSIEYERRTR